MNDKPLVIFPDPRFPRKFNVVITLLWLIAWASWSVPVAIVIGYELDSIPLGVLLAIVVNVIVLLPSYWLAGLYCKSLRYEVHEDEVIVCAGVITRSVKHVPFRTVTNLKVTRGPIDRMFGLGTLAIQTAGMSGTTGAEESLEGLTDVQSVYDLVAAELRRYRQAMPPTQASEEPESMPERDQFAGPVLAAMLDELRAIRATLERDTSA
ncbi:MAG: PH domain-containing protein [Anaerolineae bacterium]|nr:PH domain-containing protein [Anaerolineae bacterium]